MHAAPMYIAETAPSQIRGQLISLKEFLIVFGMLVSYSKTLILSKNIASMTQEPLWFSLSLLFSRNSI